MATWLWNVVVISLVETCAIGSLKPQPTWDLQLNMRVIKSKKFMVLENSEDCVLSGLVYACNYHQALFYGLKHY